MEAKKNKLLTVSSARVKTSLFLISFSIFLYQVCLLRIISISDYYHFAFLVVSIAMLGFGISGSFLYYFTTKIKNRDLILVIFSLSFAVSIFASYLLINLIPFDSFKIAWESRQIFYLFAYYFCLLLPFFFGGSFIGYVFYEEQKPGITYFFNLTGSAAGAMVFIFLVQPIGKTTIILVTFYFGVAAVLLIMSKKHYKVLISLLIFFILLVSSVFLFFPSMLQIRMSPYKSLPSLLRIPESKIIYSRENAISRVDVVESPSIKSVPGLSLAYQKVPPGQLGITIDGDNLSPITEIKDNHILEFDFLEYIPASIIFSALDAKKNLVDSKNNHENLLIIEPGGGLDVLAGIYYKSINKKPACYHTGKAIDEKSNGYEITVIQNNNLIIQILSNPEILNGFFINYSGRIYKKDNISLIEASARNYANSTDKKYDLVILSLPDSYRSVASGAYSLNENYLYTVQSFVELQKILSDDGILAITRWLQVPPSEELKIIATLVESSHYLEIEDIQEKIFAFRSWSTATVLFKNSGFGYDEKAYLKNKLKDLNYDLIYTDDASPDSTNIYNRLTDNTHHEYFKKIIESDLRQRSSIYRDYYFNIRPATDNNPYFFDFFKFRQIPDIVRYFGKTTQPFSGGGYIVLVSALIISIILSIVLIIIPLKIKKISIDIKTDYKYLIYFTALGFGFFFIELPFIQKFIMILGKPVYSLSVTLFALMLSAGIGSFISSRKKIDLKYPVAVIVLYVILLIFLFGHIQDFIISKVLWQRFLYTILIIFPVGFFMGMPFPSGIAKAKTKRPQIIPWLWAINGCSSVAGSICAVIISIHIGFYAVIAISAGLYIVALVTYRYID